MPQDLKEFLKLLHQQARISTLDCYYQKISYVGPSGWSQFADGKTPSWWKELTEEKKEGAECPKSVS